MADERKQELARELAEARYNAGIRRRELAEDLQIGDKVKANLTKYRGVWLTGAILAGLVISKIPPRTKKVIVKTGSKNERELKQAGKAGLALAALKMAFDVGKPFLMSYLTKRMKTASTRW